MAQYFLYDEIWKEGQAFTIKAEISSTDDSVTIKSYVDDNYLGEWTDREAPMFKSGSIGMRNYRLPAKFSNVCVNGCSTGNSDKASVGGWIFIGIVFGGLWLYCCIGYLINGYKSKQYGDIKANIPHFEFWKVLPQLTWVGCKVSYESMRGILNERIGGGKDENLMHDTEEVTVNTNDGYEL